MDIVEKLMVAANEATDAITHLRAQIERIAIVCTDNMDVSCNHRMALDFVRQIANDETPPNHKLKQATSMGQNS